MLLYVRSLREGNFQLYFGITVNNCTLDVHFRSYSLFTWLPVHIRDMSSLSEKHPDILDYFQEQIATI